MQEFLNVAKAVSDETRARIVMFLRSGELCVCQIVDVLGLAPSTVSKHMSILKQAELVETRREGKWTYYRLPGKSSGRAVGEIVRWLRAHVDDDPAVLNDMALLTRNKKAKRCK